jgi:hypothetical protein
MLSGSHLVLSGALRTMCDPLTFGTVGQEPLEVMVRSGGISDRKVVVEGVGRLMQAVTSAQLMPELCWVCLLPSTSKLPKV